MKPFHLLFCFFLNLSIASDFETFLNTLQSQIKTITVSNELNEEVVQGLLKEYRFMLAKPQWNTLTDHCSASHFITWLREKGSIKPVWKAVSRYARPDSQQTFDSSNRKNSKNLELASNQQKILSAFNKYSNSLADIEHKYSVNSEVLLVLAAMESRLGDFKLKYLAHEVFLTQLLMFPKFSDWMQSERLERLSRSARRNLVCLYFWATSGSDQEVRSNWAGACGVVQFLPYNFWMLKDGDNDGIHQFTNLMDGFASSAFFLNQKGWELEQLKNFDEGKIDSKQLSALLAYNRNEFYAKGLWSLAQWLKTHSATK